MIGLDTAMKSNHIGYLLHLSYGQDDFIGYSHSDYNLKIDQVMLSNFVGEYSIAGGTYFETERGELKDEQP